jgi:hypothetical protein
VRSFSKKKKKKEKKKKKNLELQLPLLHSLGEAENALWLSPTAVVQDEG